MRGSVLRFEHLTKQGNHEWISVGEDAKYIYIYINCYGFEMVIWELEYWVGGVAGSGSIYMYEEVFLI